MGYGFRLYSVKLVQGITGSKPLPFEGCGMDAKTHLSLWLDRCLAALETHETLTGMPRLRVGEGETRETLVHHAALPPSRGLPQIRWRKHATAMQKISFEVQYGTVGRYEWAIGRTSSDDADISKKSAAHIYRGIFYLPKKGDTGVLALEAVDNSAPSDIVHSWLARAACDLYDEDLVAIRGMATEEAAQHKAAIFKVNFNQIANFPKLKKMVAQSNTAELVLRKMEISTSGTPTREKIRLSNKVTTTAERRKLTAWASGILKSSADGKTDKAASVVELEKIVGDVGALDFNDGHVVVNDGSGRKKIGPGHLDQFFVYPISEDIPPSDTKFEQEVAKEVVEMKALLKIGLDVS